MSKQRKKRKERTQLEAIKSVRKPMPPPTRVINPKKYDRRDKTWEGEDGHREDENQENQNA